MQGLTGAGAVGRLLIGMGLVLVIVGVGLLLVGKVPWLGRLPGDIYVRRGSFTFYFPVMTCIILSIVMTLLARLFWR